jgi:hypothetical protein
VVIHHNPSAHRKPSPPRDRGTAAGLIVGASVVIAVIAAFTAQFFVGAAAFLFCLLIAALHANAVEPGKLRAPIAALFLAASGACAALTALAGVQGAAFLVSGWLVTGLFYAGLLIGVLKRLDLFQRLLALLLAAALPVLLLVAPPPPQEHLPLREDAWRVELTVRESDWRPVQGAGAACWAFATPAPDAGLLNALRSELSADFSAPTDEAGLATIDLTRDSGHLIFVCGAARPRAQTGETQEHTTILSPPLPTPPAGATVPLELRFQSRAQ